MINDAKDAEIESLEDITDEDLGIGDFESNEEEIEATKSWMEGSVISMGHDSLRDPDPHPFMIPGVLPAHRLALMSGAGGGGKSTLCISMAYALAHAGSSPGIKVIGHWNACPGFFANRAGATTLFASWEDTPTSISRRLAGYARRMTNNKTTPLGLGGLGEDGIGDIQFLPMHGKGPLFTASRIGDPRFTDEGEALKRIALEKKEKGLDLIVLDPAAAIFAGSENDRSQVRGFLGPLDAFASENELTIIVIAHPPKTTSFYSGSTDWQAAPRAMISKGSPLSVTERHEINGIPVDAGKKYLDDDSLKGMMDAIFNGKSIEVLRVEKANDAKKEKPMLVTWRSHEGRAELMEWNDYYNLEYGGSALNSGQRIIPTTTASQGAPRPRRPLGKHDIENDTDGDF